MIGFVVQIKPFESMWEAVVTIHLPGGRLGTEVARFRQATIAEVLAQIIALNLAQEDPVNVSLHAISAIGPTDEPTGL